MKIIDVKMEDENFHLGFESNYNYATNFNKRASIISGVLGKNN